MKSTEAGTGPVVSVVVPVYNGESFVSRCVACLKAQTLHDIEVVFVDDFSSDGTAAAIEREIADDARFRLIRQPERTDPLRCRREGVLTATGDYVMFLDIDDEFVPEACEKAVETIRREKTDLFVFGTQVVPADGVPDTEAAGCQRFLDHEPRHGRVRVTKRFLPELFKQEAWTPSVWNKIVRADVLRDIYRDFRTVGYLGYGQDFLQTILVFLSIRSLYSDIGLRLHRYHLGTGASLRAKGALTWDRFVRIMSSSNTAKALSTHLADRSDIPPNVGREIENRFVTNFRNNSARYLCYLSETDLSKGVELAVQSWGAALFETPLFRNDVPPEVLDAVLRSSAFPAPARTIRTVGFFFPGDSAPEDDHSAFANAIRKHLEANGLQTFFANKEDFEGTETPMSGPAAPTRFDRWRGLVKRRSPDFVFFLSPGDGKAVGDMLTLRFLGIRTGAVLRGETSLARVGSRRFLRTLVSTTVSGRAICPDRDTANETAPWLGFPVTVISGDDAMSTFPWTEWLSAAQTVASHDDPVRAARYAVLRDTAAYEQRNATAEKRRNARRPGLFARIQGLLFRNGKPSPKVG